MAQSSWAGRTEPAQDGPLVDRLAFRHQPFRHVCVAGPEPDAENDFDHDSVAARGSGMHDAAGGGGVDFGSMQASEEIHARMQREAAEELDRRDSRSPR